MKGSCEMSQKTPEPVNALFGDARTELSNTEYKLPGKLPEKMGEGVQRAP